MTDAHRRDLLSAYLPDHEPAASRSSLYAVADPFLAMWYRNARASHAVVEALPEEDGVTAATAPSLCPQDDPSAIGTGRSHWPVLCPPCRGRPNVKHLALPDMSHPPR